ncbi:MAG: hypothetical protein ACKVHE_36570 [Planctomycetales bacterium]
MSSLHDHRDRLRGDWLACSSFIASVAEQISEYCSTGAQLANVTIDSISVDQSDQAVLRRVQRATSQVAADISHLPPEQVELAHTSPDPAAHVYSLGVLFYHLLCGRPPFNAAHVHELRRQIRSDLPQPPRQLVHNVPAEVESICLKALEKEKARRQATPRELAATLRELISTAEDSMDEVSISALEAAPVELVVERYLLAVFVCQPSPGSESGFGEVCSSWVQSAIEDCLGATRVRSTGSRLLVEAASIDGESIAKILSDSLECMVAVKAFLSFQEGCDPLSPRKDGRFRCSESRKERGALCVWSW